MISELWTLEPADAAESAQTLAALGISAATLERANQGPDTLTLRLEGATALTDADPWVWESEMVLRRDGAVYYRGYVAETPRMGGAATEGQVVILKNVWWLLERTVYRQEWQALVETDIAAVETTRARLGNSADERRVEALLGVLETFATAAGIDVAIDGTALPEGISVPMIEAGNVTIAELVRRILRWYPSLSLVAVYDEDGTTLTVIDSAAATAVSLTLGQAPLAELDIRALPELQVDAVQVIYEAMATRYDYVETTEGDETIGTIRAWPSLVAVADTYPAEAAITRRSMVVTLPAPGAGQAPPEEDPPPVPAEPQMLRQPVQSEAWPDQGAYDTDCETWWVKRAELFRWGLGVDDIRLPRTTNEDIIAHRVRLDDGGVVQEPPSAVNPASTPVWTPDTIDDVPRELISGALSDWMGRKANPAVAEVTIAIDAAAVSDMDAEVRASFMRLGPRRYIMTIEAVEYPVWLIDCAYRFTATDALTKVYTRLLSVDYGDAADDPEAATQASYDAAAAAVVVPDLAQRLYEARSVLDYAGRVTLTASDAPAEIRLGRRVSIAAGRGEWATMRATVQQESVDLGAGTTTLAFGPAAHLAVQDWQELYSPAHSYAGGRAAAGGEEDPARQPTPPPLGEPAEDEGEDKAAQIGPSVIPKSGVSLGNSAATALSRWDIVGVDDEEEEGTHRLHAPLVFWRRTDVTETVAISTDADTFTPVADRYLVAKIDSLTEPEIELEVLATWTGYESAYEFSGSPPTFVAARIPLWKFYADEGTGIGAEARVPIGDLWGEKLVHDGPLRLFFPLIVVPSTTHFRTVPDLV